MNALQLHHSTASPNARRVRVFAAYKRIVLDLVVVDLGAREQFTDAYARINPRRLVPTLVLEDGTAIGEVPAIWGYLEERYPESPLLGTTAKTRALVTMWERRAELEGLQAVMEAVRNKAPGLAGRALAGPHAYEQIPALVARGTLRTRDWLADLEARLAQVPFVAGYAYSVADITTLVTIDFATKALGLDLPDDHLATKRWYQLVSARPGILA